MKTKHVEIDWHGGASAAEQNQRMPHGGTSRDVATGSWRRIQETLAKESNEITAQGNNRGIVARAKEIEKTAESPPRETTAESPPRVSENAQEGPMH